MMLWLIVILLFLFDDFWVKVSILYLHILQGIGLVK